MIITDPWFYIFAVPAVICLGLSKGGFAGLGMVATPLLALIMPPLQAAAILLPLLLIQDALSAWVYRKQWDAWILKVMLPGAVIGMGVAWLLVAHVSDGAIRLLVGVIALVFSAHSWLRRNRPIEAVKRPHAALGWFWGGLSSFTSALIHVGAPPYFAFVLPQRLEKMVYVATTVWFFAIVNWLKVVPYFALGQFSTGGTRDLGGPDPARNRRQCSGHLARAAHQREGVLQDHLCAGVPSRRRTHPPGHRRSVLAVSRFT